MKASKLRDMDREDLIQEESELRKQLLRIRFQAAVGQVDGAPKMKGIRRDIARIKTILTERESKKTGA
ncbi:MAG: 50S ribosomal protein L29 [Acidobacteriota bacterium]|jgi:large subunit ribosomal protein L29|nr:50S ribosomal protein L29 [Acidobacteriota bacterium]